MRSLLSMILILAIASCQNQTSQTDDPVKLSEKYQPIETTQKPEGSHTALGLAGYTKVMCSAIFVSGREPEEAFVNSGYFFMPDENIEGVEYAIDYDSKSVTMTLGDSLRSTAQYYGDQGCILQTKDGLQFSPTEVTTTLPEASTMDWPMGDILESKILNKLSKDSVEIAVDLAFSDDAKTAAFLVVYKGEIIAERYRDGIDENTQLESWSMGKSLTATLIGRLIQLGYFKLDDYAPVSAWSQEGDPRSKIRIRDLMQMSSGLRFTSHRDPEVSTSTEYAAKNFYLDHMYVYSGAIDVFDFSINRPLQFAVGSEGRYRNCDPLTLGYIIRTQLEAKGINYHTFPQKELFDKVGIRKQVMETDPYGNFVLTGFDYGTARNWARIAMLYLNDGISNGEQLLPDGWADFVSTPAPAWKEPVYGGQFWLNRTETFPIPKEAYYMGGGGGQRVIIIPSKEMVIVRLGHFRGGSVSDSALSNSLELLMRQIPD